MAKNKAKNKTKSARARNRAKDSARPGIGESSVDLPESAVQNSTSNTENNAQTNENSTRTGGSSAKGANYVPSSMPGCHVARFNADWLVDIETDLDEDTFGVSLDQIPEISVDPESGLLSVINSDQTRCKSFNLTLAGACLPAIDGKNRQLSMGSTRDDNGVEIPCVSFVLVVKPCQMMDVCFVSALPDVEGGKEGSVADLASDVQFCPLDLPGENNAEDQILQNPVPQIYFPLGGDGPFLCSQGTCGHFTHYFPGNCFAVDLECPVGTPILAVGPGIIRGVRQHECVEGIHARNLFHWNSLQLELDAGGIVEYVHIQKDSVVVSQGDRVETGQLVCRSGAVGFVPQPHLHLQMLPSLEENAASIPFSIYCRCSDHIDGIVKPQE
eukprot:CAMPEP_0171538214 /NCGR_PEP_ID=MMETSP0959-20130129/18997_1 /TAXON_ID=87120 /ORGANISM="Aurantiochytrium limacinum, Strain ATCCMYA-1381" /LENGTH=384 /DNA_ID=CAMNT_0012085069 /DNA_START=49 /DNA_END=1200 /DNA_ORIENTATION=-